MIVSWLVGTVKQKGLESCLKTASDGADATWKGRSFHDGGTRNRKRPQSEV